MFTWLTVTNAGSEEVCRAALRHQGITEAELDTGFVCDPQTKSRLRILARPGIILRLSRNIDKQRGFVNGALAEVMVSLRGNATFVAKLASSGNYVLIHAMQEDGAVFLPCCYGYATTIRRAQGASLDMGCIYFNQRRHAAGRGYGYVGVSRFRSRHGCFLFGKLRRSDFLPVGEPQDDEILERQYLSASDCSDEGSGMEHAFTGGGGVFAVSDSEDEDDADLAHDAAYLEHAFKDGISGLFVDEDFDDNADACADFE